MSVARRARFPVSKHGSTERVPGALVRALATLHLKRHRDSTIEGLARTLGDRLRGRGLRFHLRTLKRQLTGGVASVPPEVERTLREHLGLTQDGDMDRALRRAGLNVKTKDRQPLTIPMDALRPLAAVLIHSTQGGRRDVAVNLRARLRTLDVRMSVEAVAALLGPKAPPATRREVKAALLSLLKDAGLATEQAAMKVWKQKGKEIEEAAAAAGFESPDRVQALAALWQRRHRATSTRALAEALRARLPNDDSASVERLQGLFRPGKKQIRRRIRMELETLLRAEAPNGDLEKELKESRQDKAADSDRQLISTGPLVTLAKTWLAANPTASARQLSQAVERRSTTLGYKVSAVTVQSILGGWKKQTRGFIGRALQDVIDGHEPVVLAPAVTPKTKPAKDERKSGSPASPDDDEATEAQREKDAEAEEDDAPAPAVPAPTGPRTMEPDATALDRYYRDIAGLHVLRPHEEFKLASTIEDAERSLWDHLLSFPASSLLIVESLRKTTAVAEVDLKAPIDEYEKWSKRRIERDTAPSRASFAKAATALAVAVHPKDDDGIFAQAIVVGLRGLRAKPPRGDAGPRKPVPGGVAATRALDAHLQRMEGLVVGVADSKHVLYQANLRLVLAVARGFRGRGLPLEDLIQEGNLGLLKAVDRYDHRRGFRFSTYATWWIRHAIGRGVADRSRTVRLPVHIIDELRKVEKARRQLEGELGRPPLPDEISKTSGVPQETVDLARAAETPLSLDQPLPGEDDGRTRMDLLADPTDARAADDQMAVDQAQDRLTSLLSSLSPIEQDVLRRRFGLGVHDEHTLEEVGNRHGLSRERIRQLQAQALEKLRRLSQDSGIEL